MDKRVFLDNNATTQMDPRVLSVMQEELSSPPSNPSSVHYFGQEARKRLTQARQTIATCLSVKPNELIFTSGGTESLNSLLRGFCAKEPKAHLITSDIEHSSVYNTIKHLEKQGIAVTYLPAESKGYITAESVEKALLPTTRLIVLSAVNSETGIKNPIAEIAQLAHDRKIPLLVDGVALMGKELFSIPQGVTAMAFSAHKFHGPKGVGLTFVRKEFKWDPLFSGGDQEYSKRAGTENLAGILGLAKAIELLNEELPFATQRMQKLRDHFEETLSSRCQNLLIYGKESPRIANTSGIAFPDIDGEGLLLDLDLNGIAVSHGSACASGALQPSRVLLNMGVSPSLARSSLRFSLSRFTTQAEIDHTLTVLLALLGKHRSFRETQKADAR
jgi:cysteine desulfurase